MSKKDSNMEGNAFSIPNNSGDLSWEEEEELLRMMVWELLNNGELED